MKEKVIYMNDERLIKNITPAEAVNLMSLVEYQEGQVVSRTLSQGKTLSFTLFAFDKGEEISSHSSPGDAFVYILDGQAEVTIGQEKQHLTTGQAVLMPKNIPHALHAEERFKMLLLVVFKLV